MADDKDKFDTEKMLDTPCSIFPSNPTFREMAEVVQARRQSDPEFDAQCKQDIEDFFTPSPLLKRLRGK